MISPNVCTSIGALRVLWISPRSSKPTESGDRLTAASAGVDDQARVGDRACSHPGGGECPGTLSMALVLHSTGFRHPLFVREHALAPRTGKLLPAAGSSLSGLYPRHDNGNGRPCVN